MQLESNRLQLMVALQNFPIRKKYVIYNRDDEKIDIIMSWLDDRNYSYGDGVLIAQMSGIPTSTISDWRQKKKKDPNYNPLHKKTNIGKRVFTDQEEEETTEYIIDNIIKQGILFTNEDFKLIIMDAFNEKYMYEDDYNKIPKFNASDGFVTDFKNRNNFVSRRLHAARRPLVRNFDDIFAEQMDKLFKTVPPCYIINIDEISWEVVPLILKSWHVKGKDHVLRYINSNCKERIAVLAGVRADGIRLPLQFIATGKTERVLETQIGDVNYHFKTFSENGWTTKDTFKLYILELRDLYGVGVETLHIILDAFSAHISEEIREFAELNNIKLYFIPQGFTDQLQLLDVKLFGILKSIARRLFMERYRSNPYAKRTKKDACQDLIYAWEKLDIDTIKESFQQLKILQ